MSDLVWRLRSMARNEHDDLSVGDEAADEIERLRAEVARLTAERDALAVELKRVQRLPELEWAEACSRILQVLASAARAGFPVRDSVAVAAMDEGKVYVDRILAERDAALALAEAAEKDEARYREALRKIVDAHERNTLYSGAGHWNDARAVLAQLEKEGLA